MNFDRFRMVDCIHMARCIRSGIMIRSRPMRPLSAMLFLTLLAVSFAAEAASLPAPHQIDIPSDSLTLHAQLYNRMATGRFPP